MTISELNGDCYGCGACVQICPKDAICIQENERGFLDAKIEKNKCVNCGLCSAVCVKEYENSGNGIQVKKAMYGFNSNEDDRRTSTSGGIFIEIARMFIEAGDYVVGCIWDKDWMPEHVLTNDMEVVRMMQKSKYVQSNIVKVYKPMIEAIRQGKKVLFSGTPCQIAATRKVIKDENNVFYLSVVCHGVSSRGIWRKYVKWLESIHGKIVKLRMREKPISKSDDYAMYIENQEGRGILLEGPKTGQFMQCFKEGLFVSGRCNKCQFKGDSIGADIIIGDGWGADKFFDDFDDGQGVSCILIKSENGEKLWEKLQKTFAVRDIDVDLVVKSNQRLVSPAKVNRRTFKFYKKVSDRDMISEEILEKSMYVNTIEAKMKRVIRKMMFWTRH